MSSSRDRKSLARFGSLPWRGTGALLVTAGFLALALSMQVPLGPKLASPVVSRPTAPADVEGLDPHSLGFLGRLEPSPLQELRAVEPGWVHEFLVEPGELAAKERPLVSLWKEPPPGEEELPKPITSSLARVEKAEREQAAIKTAMQEAAERLKRLRHDMETARAELASARTKFDEVIGKAAETAESEKAARSAYARKLDQWRGKRDVAVKEAAAAKKSVDEAQRKALTAERLVLDAEEAMHAAAAELAKQKRLHDLGVVARAEVDKAKAVVTGAEAAVAEAKSDAAKAARELGAAREREKAAAAKVKAAGDKPPPEPKAALPPDLTEYERTVSNAKTNAAAVRSKLEAELKSVEKLREAQEHADERLRQAQEEWKQSQIEVETPSGDLFTTVAAPEALLVEKLVAEERSRIGPEATLLAYRLGTGWQVAFTVGKVGAEEIAPGSFCRPGGFCRAKLLVEGFPVVWAQVRTVAPSSSGGARVEALLLEPIEVEAPVDVLVKLEKQGPPPPPESPVGADDDRNLPE